MPKAHHNDMHFLNWIQSTLSSTPWATEASICNPLFSSFRFSTCTIFISSHYEPFLPHGPGQKYQNKQWQHLFTYREVSVPFPGLQGKPVRLRSRTPSAACVEHKGFEWEKQNKKCDSICSFQTCIPVRISSSHCAQVHRPFNWYTATRSLARADAAAYLTERMRATISPYNPNTSAKIRMRIMPTNNLGCWAVPRTPASPTIPMAKPAARPLNPTLMPAPKCKKLLQQTQGDIKNKMVGQLHKFIT